VLPSLTCPVYSPNKAKPIQGVAIMPSQGGSPTRSVDIPMEPFRWAADGRSLLFIKYASGVSNIWSQPIAGGAPKQITHFNAQHIWDFDLSLDGKRIVIERGEVTGDAVLIHDLR